jgi:hypothetical protein
MNPPSENINHSLYKRLWQSQDAKRMTISRWERGAQEPPSHGYIGLGNLSRDATIISLVGEELVL